MSRIVSLKTVRFQTFNILDSWHTNWADDFHYGHLLFEDLGIRSYFIGIFYRLRMPTNYIYLHRMSGNTMMLNTDVYFYKPFKRTKLRRYFVEQRQYLNYILKLYLYLIPHMFSFVKRSSSFNKQKDKRVSFFDVIRLQQYNNMGFLGLKSNPFLLESSISQYGVYKSFYSFSDLYSNNFLLSSTALSQWQNQYRVRVSSRTSSIFSTLGNALSRVLYILSSSGSNISSVVPFLNLLSIGLGLKHFIHLRQLKFLSLNGCSSLSVFFSKRNVRSSRLKKRLLSFFKLNPTQRFFVDSIRSFSRLSIFFLKMKQVGLRHVKFKLFYSKTRRTLYSLFLSWYNNYLKRFLLSFLFKLLTSLFSSLRFNKFKLVYNQLFLLASFFVIQTQIATRSLYNHTINYINPNAAKLQFIHFFSRVRNLHLFYYKGKRATTNSLHAPKKFQFTHVNIRFLKLFFSYFFNHIETILSAYTKQNVYCLYNLFYLGGTYYPPILNAKVICDYFIYMMHNRKSIRGAFYKVRQWQLANIQRRISMESMYFKTQMKRKPKVYLDHLSYKKYPIMGIRIECSGNKKKGTMARKFFYGDVIKTSGLVQKSPNNTLASDMDYYQSFALTKSCTIGVKVWVFFKTYLYDMHGAIKTMIVY